MTLDTVHLQISTPSEPILPGRGFYQLEEDSLYVQVGQFSNRRKFFSYLESDVCRFEFDRTGKLIFLEVTVPRRQWDIDSGQSPPAIIEPADVRWVNFREDITPPRLLTNKPRTSLKIEFRAVKSPLNYYLADSVILQVEKDNRLAAVWITEIVDDLAGQEIRRFRKNLRLEQSYYA